MTKPVPNDYQLKSLCLKIEKEIRSGENIKGKAILFPYITENFFDHIVTETISIPIVRIIR